MEWLLFAQATLDTNGKLAGIFRAALRKVKRQTKKARYPIYFDVQPLVDWALGPPTTTEKSEILDRLLIQIRLTTMMRSVDVSQVVWGVFEYQNRYFIHTTNKQGALATFSVEGVTLQTLLEYIEMHLEYPGTHLIRYLNCPSRCMGSERIAKRVKVRMQQQGIPTECFKAHSLRGATATHYLLHGMEPQWVQTRGGWSSPETMQVYYNRLHQHQSWEQALQGKIGTIKHFFSSVVPASTPLPYLKPTQEGGRGVRGKAQHC